MSLQTISTQLEHRWLHDGRVVAYIPQDTTRATVDVWVKTVSDDVLNWPTTRPFLAIHDFSRIGLTPYSREQGEAVLKLVPTTLTGRHAFVVARSVLGYGMRFFGMNRFSQLCPQLEPGFFFSFDAALEWVVEWV